MTVATVTVTINGNTVTLTKGSNNVWTGTLTAPAQTSGSHNGGVGPGVGSAAASLGYYPATVTATDTAGNTVSVVGTGSGTLSESARLEVEEKTAPTASSLSPSSGARLITATPTIQYSVADAGSGIDASKCYIQIDGGSAFTVTPTLAADLATGTVSYTIPAASKLSEGSHTVKAWCYDLDGNKSTELSTTFSVDTIAPTLNVTAPTTGSITNVQTCAVIGTTNDATSSPVTITIKLNGVDQGTVSVVDGAFSHNVTLADGENTIIVTATDSSGLTTSQTMTVTLDQAPPVITSIVLTPNPADGGATVSISVTVTDA